MTQPRPYLIEHQIADAIVPDMEQAFLRAVQLAKDQVSLNAIMLGIREDNLDVRTPTLGMQILMFREFRDMFEEVIPKAARAHMDLLPSDKVTKALFDFDLSQAMQWILQHARELAAGVVIHTQNALRALLGNMGGMTPAQQSQFVRDLVGLDERRAIALNRFRLSLIDQEVPAERAERLVTRYRDRLLRNRARTIARTESIAVASEGQQQTWLQAIQQGLLDNDRVRRRPVITPDNRLCPICAPMPSNPDNLVMISQPFITGDDRLVMNPPFHPNCRCSQRLVFADRNGNYPGPPSETPAFGGASGPPRKRHRPRA